MANIQFGRLLLNDARLRDGYFTYITLVMFREYQIPVDPTLTLEQNAELKFPIALKAFSCRWAGHRCDKPGCGVCFVGVYVD